MLKLLDHFRRSTLIILHSLLILVSGLAGCTSPPAPRPTQTVQSITAAVTAQPTAHTLPTEPSATATSTPSPTATPPPEVPYELISRDSLFAFLEDLTSIQPYSGWRNSASSGEEQALDYVQAKLEAHTFLQNIGLELERQTFPVYLSVEIWETGLEITAAGKTTRVPANGLRGSRYDPRLARNFDSDGGLNDSDRDPMIVAGPPLVVRDELILNSLDESQITGRVIFLDYSLIDYFVSGEAAVLAQQLGKVIAQKPAGIVLVTQYSNKLGDSRGTTAGDGGIFQSLDFSPSIPILLVRLEDMAPAGITTWLDLARIDDARLTWDEDVFSPGKSGSLVARIPGADPSQAVILSAHIDSPNSPGAFDNGSGSAVLLEIARVLESARLQPGVDLYLVWYGSHELGLYGSANFVSTHQDLLDRTIAMLQIDCLSHPLEGRSAEILADTWSYGQFGDDRLLWPDFLAQVVQPQNVKAVPINSYSLTSDNSNYNAFNVPNINLEYFQAGDLNRSGLHDVHYAGHLHEPYETLELAREVAEPLEDMAKVALAAALETGWQRPDLRVAPEPQRRALFVASHTEPVNIAPTVLLELGMALAWEGFDVDLIPYEQTLTANDLENVSLVVLLPTLDFPHSSGWPWSEAERSLLDAYVAQGGFLLVANSAYGISMVRHLEDLNEDTGKINPLLEKMGITFSVGIVSQDIVLTQGDHPLIAEAQYLNMFPENGVPLKVSSGQVLATAQGRPVIAIVDYGAAGGQVLVISDIGLLVDYGQGGKNLNFVKNIARYAKNRSLPFE